MVTLSKVSKWYPNFQVLKHCSTEVAKVVCGPWGSGKSTLIKCVNGLEPFQEGAITVAAISVSDPKTTCRSCAPASAWCFSIKGVRVAARRYD
jgi:glutamate/aspartate transport system ATP-binding protein